MHLIQPIAKLQEAVVYIDWKQSSYDDVLSEKTEYHSNLLPEQTTKFVSI